DRSAVRNFDRALEGGGRPGNTVEVDRLHTKFPAELAFFAVRVRSLRHGFEADDDRHALPVFDADLVVAVKEIHFVVRGGALDPRGEAAPVWVEPHRAGPFPRDAADHVRRDFVDRFHFREQLERFGPAHYAPQRLASQTDGVTEENLDVAETEH